MKVFEADNLAVNLEAILKDCKGIVAYKLARNLRLLETELTEFRKVKTDLFRKYGKQDGDRIIINKDDDNYQKFLDEMKVYENEEICVEFRKLTEEEIVNSNLNGEQIYLLDRYMVE